MTPTREPDVRDIGSLAGADGRPPFVDIHCHCLPGFDDGPAAWPEAVALCQSMAADRVETIVATPHQLGRFEGHYDTDEIRNAVAEMNRCIEEARLPLAILPGADVRLDERIPQLLESDAILTVADSHRYLLLELPHDVFIDPDTLLVDLRSMAVTAVITHPERHPHLIRNSACLGRWAEHGACLQITAASFGGGFGRQSQEAAWRLIHAPMPVVVATDAHNTAGRAPRMSEAYGLLAERFGYCVAEILCVENPRRMIQGRDLLMLVESDVRGESVR